jgi:hypothetical protein
MMRVVLHVALLGALFAGAVLWAGNAIGAWEPPSVPLHAPPAASTETTKAPKAKNPQHKKHHGPAKPAKKH